MQRAIYLTCLSWLFLAACSSDPSKTNKPLVVSDSVKSEMVDSVPATPSGPIADAATILARKEVPVLCYHHILNFKSTDSENKKTYSVTPEAFAAQMKLLSDSGYKTILPDQLFNYLAYGTALPEKPVMLTFDDTDEEQYTLGATEMKKYGFKGVFFIMTIFHKPSPVYDKRTN
jgi:hypothetical protein